MLDLVCLTLERVPQYFRGDGGAAALSLLQRVLPLCKEARLV